MPSLYICLQKDLPSYKSGDGEGNALSRQEPQLSALAKQLGVKPLMEFFSAKAGEMSEFLDSGAEDDLPPLEEKWFPAASGIATIEELLKYLRSNPSSVGDSEKVINELTEFNSILLEAEKAQVGWHLAVDF